MAKYTYTVATATAVDQTREFDVESYEDAKREISNYIQLVKGLNPNDFTFELDESTNHITATRRVAIGDKGAEYTIVIELTSGVKSHTVDAESDAAARISAEAIIQSVYGLSATDFDIIVDAGKVTAERKNLVIGSKG